jgi:hypothetical protein
VSSPRNGPTDRNGPRHQPGLFPLLWSLLETVTYAARLDPGTERVLTREHAAGGGALLRRASPTNATSAPTPFYVTDNPSDLRNYMTADIGSSPNQSRIRSASKPQQ